MRRTQFAKVKRVVDDLILAEILRLKNARHREDQYSEALAHCSKMAAHPLLRNGAMRDLTLPALFLLMFQLSSPQFQQGGALPPELAYNRSGCTGRNISPALTWAGAPQGAKSLALILFDPDAGRGRGWTHWVAYGIDPSTTSLRPGAPAAKGGKNSWGDTIYDGPCPPPGDSPHHYVFTLYAVDLAPDALAPGLDRDALLAAIKGHVLGTAELTGMFGR
jgi:Raf kinase inhibitor-like YbhB/YbcL family protein